MGPNHIPEVIWPLTVATFAIAFIATAFVQLLKELIPIRRWFQRSYLRNWFMERPKQGQKQIPSSDEAENDLVRLATGGDLQAFYNLETPQLCGQMNSAAQIALAYPDRHPDLLRFLAPEAKEDDLGRVVKTK